MYSTAARTASSDRSVRPPFAGIMPAWPWKPSMRVLLERRRALRDARRPGGLVADLRRAGDAGAVAGAAGDIEHRLAVGRHRRGIAAGAAGDRRRPWPGSRAPLLSSPATATWPNGLMRSCAEACISGSSVSRAPFGPLSTRREMPIRTSAIAIEDADHRAENVDEMTVWLGHARIIASGRPDH